MDYVEYRDGAWRAKDISDAERTSHQAFEVGQKVKTDFGKGHIQQLVQGKPGWSRPRYYLIQLMNHQHPHLFAEHEIRKFNFQLGVS